MIKISGITLAAGLMLALATPAIAAKPAALTPGGRTLAGPGTTSVAAVTTEAVYTDSSGNADACATVVNLGKSPLQVSMIGNGTSTIDVPVGATGALCLQSVVRVDLICVGPLACRAQWRIDNN